MTTGCTVPECERARWAKGMCLMHYKRVWRHGSVERTRAAPSMTRGDRLRRVGWDVSDQGCWVFRGRRRKNGRCEVRYQNRMEQAHRLAYAEWVGPIPGGLVVRHRCDNPPCINPDHLELGTQLDNMRDMVERRRFHAKLTVSDVGDIRRVLRDPRRPSMERIGEMFGVSGSAVQRIASGTSWGWYNNDKEDVCQS